MDWVSVSFSGVGVLNVVDGVLEMTVSVVIGEGVGTLVSVSVSFLGGGVRIVVVGEVMRKVIIELVVMLKVCVIGTVFGVSLIVTTVLVTR